MKAKLLTTVCVLAITLFSTTPSFGADALAVAADTVIARPLCLAATLVGSVLFVVSLPVAALSKSVDRTADALVVKPAAATFTRPLGDFSALKE